MAGCANCSGSWRRRGPRLPLTLVCQALLVGSIEAQDARAGSTNGWSAFGPGLAMAMLRLLLRCETDPNDWCPHDAP
jgi:hypothetical protein